MVGLFWSRLKQLEMVPFHVKASSFVPQWNFGEYPHGPELWLFGCLASCNTTSVSSKELAHIGT